jgi:hypothetical protein
MINSLKAIFVIIEVIKIWSPLYFCQYICSLANEVSDGLYWATVRCICGVNEQKACI